MTATVTRHDTWQACTVPAESVRDLHEISRSFGAAAIQWTQPGDGAWEVCVATLGTPEADAALASWEAGKASREAAEKQATKDATKDAQQARTALLAALEDVRTRRLAQAEAILAGITSRYLDGDRKVTAGQVVDAESTLALARITLERKARP